MGDFREMDLEIYQSWNRCIEYSVDVNISKPQISVSESELQKLLDEEKELIKIFESTAENFFKISDQSKYALLLFSKDKILLSAAAAQEELIKLKENGIEAGVSFSEKSIGVNSVAFAEKKDKSVYLEAEKHFCRFMRKVSCCAVPLKISGSMIGFLSAFIFSSGEDEKLESAVDILSNTLINKLHLVECRKYKNLLSPQQLEILSLLANGKTEAEIAEILNYSVQTIKYHKRKIFDKFEVENTRSAITKLYKYHDSKCLFN